MTKSNTRVKNLTSKWNQKYQHFFPNAYRSLLYIQFIAVAFQTTLKKKSFGEGPLIDQLWPCPGSAPWRVWPKSQYKCAGFLEYFIPTKFVKYPSSDSVVKADSVFQYIYMN